MAMVKVTKMWLAAQLPLAIEYHDAERDLYMKSRRSTLSPDNDLFERFYPFDPEGYIEGYHQIFYDLSYLSDNLIQFDSAILSLKEFAFLNVKGS